MDNQACIKQFGDKYHLTAYKFGLRQTGIDDNINRNDNRNVNDNKLDTHVCRAKKLVFEYASCNDFEYFITLTLDKLKQDRYDLGDYKKSLGIFIKNYNKKYKTHIKYLLVPEQHQDGAWHIHGLVGGISKEQLINFDNIKNAPQGLKNKEYYNWPEYERKFGFNSLGLIRNKDAVSKYMTKYISKDLGKGVEKEKHLLIKSRNLKKAAIIKKGTLGDTSDLEYDYETDYTFNKVFDNDLCIKYIID